MSDRGGRNRFPGAGAARFYPANPWQTEVSTNVTTEKKSLMFFSVFYILLFQKTALFHFELREPQNLSEFFIYD